MINLLSNNISNLSSESMNKVVNLKQKPDKLEPMEQSMQKSVKILLQYRSYIPKKYLFLSRESFNVFDFYNKNNPKNYNKFNNNNNYTEEEEEFDSGDDIGNIRDLYSLNQSFLVHEQSPNSESLYEISEDEFSSQESNNSSTNSSRSSSLSESVIHPIEEEKEEKIVIESLSPPKKKKNEKNEGNSSCSSVDILSDDDGSSSAYSSFSSNLSENDSSSLYSSSSNDSEDSNNNNNNNQEIDEDDSISDSIVISSCSEISSLREPSHTNFVINVNHTVLLISLDILYSTKNKKENDEEIEKKLSQHSLLLHSIEEIIEKEFFGKFDYSENSGKQLYFSFHKEDKINNNNNIHDILKKKNKHENHPTIRAIKSVLRIISFLNNNNNDNDNNNKNDLTFSINVDFSVCCGSFIYTFFEYTKEKHRSLGLMGSGYEKLRYFERFHDLLRREAGEGQEEEEERLGRAKSLFSVLLDEKCFKNCVNKYGLECWESFLSKKLKTRDMNLEFSEADTEDLVVEKKFSVCRVVF